MSKPIMPAYMDAVIVHLIKIRDYISALTKEHTNTDTIWSIVDEGVELYTEISGHSGYTSLDFIMFAMDVKNRTSDPKTSLAILSNHINTSLAPYRELVTLISAEVPNLTIN